MLSLVKEIQIHTCFQTMMRQIFLIVQGLFLITAAVVGDELYPQSFDNPLMEKEIAKAVGNETGKRKRGQLSPRNEKKGEATPATKIGADKQNTLKPRGKLAQPEQKKQEGKGKFQEAFPSFQPLSPTQKETAAQKPKQKPQTTTIVESPVPQKKLPISGDEEILINFRNINMIELINFISKQSGKNFIFNDAELQFPVSIISEEPATIQSVLTALMQVLQIRGLSMIEQDNNIVIHSNPTMRSPAKIITEQSKDYGSEDAQIVTRVFQLSTMDPAKVADVIRPLVSSQAIVESVEQTNHLIITDLYANIKKITKLIKSIDAPGSNFHIGQYIAQNSYAANLAPMAQRILAPVAQDKPILFIPQQKANKIFIVSTPNLVEQGIVVLKELDVDDDSEGVKTLENLRKKLDRSRKKNYLEEYLYRDPVTGELIKRYRKKAVPFGEEEGAAPDALENVQFFIHKLQHRTGQQIADALKRMAESLQISTTTNQQITDAINTVQSIDETNTLIFVGTGGALRKIQELVKEIDVPVKQVFVEMLILDTSVVDSLQYGVEWGSRFNNDDAAGEQTFLNTSGAANPSKRVPGADRSATDLRPKGFELGIIGKTLLKDGTLFSNLGALVKASHTDKKTRILHNPKVIVEDNATAEFFAGENTAFATDSFVVPGSDSVQQSFEFKDIGTTLKVTPHISSSNVITLDIEQEQSTVAPDALRAGASVTSGTSGGGGSASSGASPGPTTLKETTTTRIHVPNNYFVILSGNVKDTDVRERNQVPCLGGIPIGGAAFSNKANNLEKRITMIFIRPHIVETEEEIDYTTKRQQDIFNDQVHQKDRWHYEVEEGLDWMNLDKDIHKPKTYHGAGKKSPCDKGPCGDCKQKTW